MGESIRTLKGYIPNLLNTHFRRDNHRYQRFRSTNEQPDLATPNKTFTDAEIHALVKTNPKQLYDYLLTGHISLSRIVACKRERGSDDVLAKLFLKNPLLIKALVEKKIATIETLWNTVVQYKASDGKTCRRNALKFGLYENARIATSTLVSEWIKNGTLPKTYLLALDKVKDDRTLMYGLSVVAPEKVSQLFITNPELNMSYYMTQSVNREEPSISGMIRYNATEILKWIVDHRWITTQECHNIIAYRRKGIVKTSAAKIYLKKHGVTLESAVLNYSKLQSSQMC